jgi:hypothetical protein
VKETVAEDDVNVSIELVIRYRKATDRSSKLVLVEEWRSSFSRHVR